MKTLILYPADYFNIRKPDPDYEYEYREAVRFPDLMAGFYNYDGFMAKDRLKFYPWNPAPAFTGDGCLNRISTAVFMTPCWNRVSG